MPVVDHDEHAKTGSSLAEVGEHGVDQLERLVDFLAHLGTSQDDLAGHEDEEYNLGLHHAIDETREELGLVRAEHVVTACQAFETDWELDVARADDVLDLEVRELCVEAKLLDDTRVFAGSKFAVVFGLGTSDNHLARSEDQSGRLGLTDTHNDRGETLGRMLAEGRKPWEAVAPRTLGLYSALRACRAMVFRSRRQSRLTVATMFL
jgi:hypothetical protein